MKICHYLQQMFNIDNNSEICVAFFNGYMFSKKNVQIRLHYIKHFTV